MADSNQHPGVQAFELQRGRKNISLPVDYDLRIAHIRGHLMTDVSSYIDHLDWTDSSDGAAGGMSGSMTAHRSNPLDPGSLPLTQGDRIAFQYRDAFSSHGRWHEEVRMQVDSPQASPATGAVAFTLDSPFIAFENVEAMFIYRKDKHHKAAWRMDDIIKDACKKVGAPFNPHKIAKGRVDFPAKFEGDPLGDDKKHTPRSPLLAFIWKCINHERRKTGRQLTVVIVNGKLEVIERGASTHAYVLDPTAQEFSVETTANTRPPTIIHADGRVGKGKAAKTHKITVRAPRASDKYGEIIREQNFGRVDSVSELRDDAKRLLANGSKESKGLRVVRTATVTVPGLPGVRPFDAVVLAPPRNNRGVPEYQGHFSELEFGDENGLCYISSRSHTVDGGIWTTQLSLQERDPWLRYRRRLAEKKVGYRLQAKNPAPRTSNQGSTTVLPSAHSTSPTSSSSPTHRTVPSRSAAARAPTRNAASTRKRP